MTRQAHYHYWSFGGDGATHFAREWRLYILTAMTAPGEIERYRVLPVLPFHPAPPPRIFVHKGHWDQESRLNLDVRWVGAANDLADDGDCDWTGWRWNFPFFGNNGAVIKRCHPPSLDTLHYYCDRSSLLCTGSLKLVAASSLLVLKRKPWMNVPFGSRCWVENLNDGSACWSARSTHRRRRWPLCPLQL